MSKSYGIVPAYHRIQERKRGALPTTREIAQETGASVSYVSMVLRENRLDYTRISDQGPALAAKRRAREEKDAEFARKYAQLMQRYGRCPTRTEMNRAMGYAGDSRHGRTVAERLGLELERWQHGKPPADKKQTSGPAPAKAVIPPVDAAHDFGHRATPNMVRILEIKRSGDRTADGTAGLRAGERYAVTDRSMILCPVCGSQKLIAPRMHPFWLRNRADEVIFVCSRGCTGQSI